MYMLLLVITSHSALLCFTLCYVVFELIEKRFTIKPLKVYRVYGEFDAGPNVHVFVQYIQVIHHIKFLKPLALRIQVFVYLNRSIGELLSLWSPSLYIAFRLQSKNNG